MNGLTEYAHQRNGCMVISMVGFMHKDSSDCWPNYSVSSPTYSMLLNKYGTKNIPTRIYLINAIVCFGFKTSSTWIPLESHLNQAIQFPHSEVKSSSSSSRRESSIHLAV